MSMLLAAQHVHQSSRGGAGMFAALGVMALLIWRDKRKGGGG